MLKVCCAIIERNGKVLAVQRSATMSHPLKWEFPGGKLDSGESPEACVVREVREELGMIVTIRKQLNTVIHNYPGLVVELSPFICSTSEEPVLTEHIAFLWLSPSELSSVDWLEADIEVSNNYVQALDSHSASFRY